MRSKISLIAAGVLAGSTLFADSTSIADALKNGSFSGEFAVYGEYARIKDADNYGFGSGSFDMLYSTDTFYGFKLSAGSRANHAFWELEDNNYEQQDKAILHTANIAYTHTYFDVIFGRQEVNLNWASDYHEALVGVLKMVPDTQIIVGYTQRVATASYDEPLVPFDKLGKDGAFVTDAQWRGVEGLVVNPFVYYANDVASWGGAKVDYDLEISNFKVGGTAQYTLSKEKTDGAEDGSFLQLEARGGFNDLSAKVGYFGADKKGGVGSIKAAGDNVNPFEDGCQIFLVDAKTIYVGADYEFNEFTFSALYGNTKLGEGKVGELNLGAEYKLSEKLAAKGIFVNKNGDESSNQIKLQAVYSF